VKSSLTVIGYPKLTRASVTLRWPHTYRPGSKCEVAAILARDSWLARPDASSELTGR